MRRLGPSEILPTAEHGRVSIDRVSDAELVARARQGDAAAFGELVDWHRTAVYRVALAALGSHEEAEDAAQDAFVTAYRRLAGFRGDASFKTWLLTIAWRHALNRRRARWWRSAGRAGQAGQAGLARQRGEAGQVGRAGPAGLEELSSPNRSPEQAALDHELRSAIVAEIRALPAKLRDTLLLAQAGEYDYEEIGAMLGAPVGTVKWRVSEARKTIRRRLGERGFSDVG